MTRLYTLLLLLFFASVGCRTASKAYQKGDYTNAIELGVKKLQKDPNDTRTRDLIRQSYTYMVSAHEDQIRVLSNSNSDARFEQIFGEYVALQHLYEVVHQYPAVSAQIATRDYSSFVTTYRDKAAETHQVKGDQWMAQETKGGAREAFREFNLALSFRPDDFELRRKRDEAYDAALTRIVIAPMQSYRGYEYSSYYQLENFQRDIIRTLANSMDDHFVRFYTDFEARSQNIQPDQIMELNLSRITIGRPNDERSLREISKEVVVKETVYKKDSVIKEYATIKARIITTKRTLLSQGDLFIIVRDREGRVVWSNNFTGEYRWASEFTTYTGDERALTEEDKKLMDKKDYRVPTEEQIMGELMRQIQSDLSFRLRNHYNY